MTKTISIIGSVGIPSRYGGFETLTEQLCKILINKFALQVYCSKKAYTPSERTDNWKGVRRFFISTRANGISSIIYDFRSLFMASKSDIILILGCSGALAIPIFRLFYPSVKLILHTDGTEWKRLKWNMLARLFLYLSTKIGCIFSHSIIIDNQSLLQLYLSFKNKVSVITYGGDQYHLKQNARNEYWLTIARAEKENNLEVILNSFKNNKTEKWILLTNWTSTKHGRLLHQTASEYKNITLIDACYNSEEITSLLENCKGYIHGHSNGGTNPSLTTALWTKKRIICHDNPFNRETTQNYADFFISSDDLENLIQTDSSPEKIQLCYELAQKKYTWKKITEQYTNLFEEI